MIDCQSVGIRRGPNVYDYCKKLGDEIGWALDAEVCTDQFDTHICTCTELLTNKIVFSCSGTW